jgi:hypothetical protein
MEMEFLDIMQFDKRLESFFSMLFYWRIFKRKNQTLLWF